MSFFDISLNSFSVDCKVHSNITMLTGNLYTLTLNLLFTTTPTFANSVGPDQMASEEAI